MGLGVSLASAPGGLLRMQRGAKAKRAVCPTGSVWFAEPPASLAMKPRRNRVAVRSKIPTRRGSLFLGLSYRPQPAKHDVRVCQTNE